MTPRPDRLTSTVTSNVEATISIPNTDRFSPETMPPSPAIHTSVLPFGTSSESAAKTSVRLAVKIAEWLRQTLRTITVEPMLFFHMAGMIMMITISQSLLVYKVCRVRYGQSEEVCLDMRKANSSLAHDVNAVAAEHGMYWTLIRTGPTILFALFLGPWSDQHGRKIPMMLPLAGATIASVVYIVASHFESLPPEVLMAAPVILGVTGDIITFMQSVCSYISDITDSKSRTVRIAFAYGIWYIGSPVGSVMAGALKEHFGFRTAFIVSCSFFLFCTIYIGLRIQEKVCKDESKGGLKDLFNIHNVADSFRVCLKKRNNNQRLYVWLMIFCLCSLYLPLRGEGSVRYLYMKLKFHWDDTTYTYYTALNTALGSFSMIVLLPLLTRFTKVTDPILAICGVLAKSVSEGVIAFSTVGWIAFLAPLTLMGESAGVAIRSMMTKCVEPNEVGRMFTLLTVTEAALPLLSSVMFSRVYYTTLKIFPGTVYVITTAIYLLVLAIVCWLAYDMRKLQKKVSLPSKQTIEDTQGVYLVSVITDSPIKLPLSFCDKSTQTEVVKKMPLVKRNSVDNSVLSRLKTVALTIGEELNTPPTLEEEEKTSL